MRRLAALAAGRLACYIESSMDIRRKGLKEQYADLLPFGISKQEIEELYAVFLEEMKTWPRLQRIFLLLKPVDLPGKIAWVCLELAVLYYQEPRIAGLLEALCPGSGSGATIELAGKLVYGNEMQGAETGNHFWEFKTAYQRIELLLQAEYPAKHVLRANLRADDRLIDWLSGDDDLTLLSPRFLTWYLPEHVPIPFVPLAPVFHTGVLEELAVRFQGMRNGSAGNGNTGSMNPTIIFLTGEPFSGRKFLLKQFADRFGFTLLMADAAFLGNLDSVLIQFRKLLREVLFAPVLLCITNLPKREDTISLLTILTEEYRAVLKQLQALAIWDVPAQYPLLLSGAAGIKAAPALAFPLITKELTLPDREESAAAWKYFSTRYLKQGSLPDRELAVKMRLPIGRIEQVVKQLAALPVETRQVRTIFRCCYELLDDGRYDNIKRVETSYTYNDLKLEESQKSIIRDICAQVEYRRRVLDEWNLKSRYSYGTCVSALFTGPPGTGKTMAVHVIAGMLGLELFRVDLSQLVDKYIGETEKRLEEVFQKAERSNMILFFDEADAIIGKRSEVKEAKDKYANTEVSYLLQRMEEFDGIVILSSNYSQNIDAAFMRRIRFTVHFPIPDIATRKEIWQSAFAKEVPCGSLDFDYLSRQFEFTGGQIKNIVWNAVFFAAAEESAVEMHHLIRAIQLELTKDKKVSFQEVLGEYAHLLY